LTAAARVLHDADDLRTATQRLGQEISAAHPDGVVMVAVLKGSVLFVADLVRQLSIPVEIDFLGISSYAPDTGRVRLTKDVGTDLTDREVILVEDVVDTGLTLAYLLTQLKARNPASLDVCTLFDKRARRIVPQPLAHVGFEIGDEFVLGYGLDFRGRYRNLDLVATGDLDVLAADPDAYVGDLYPSA
jgi:hypoxanthine phosphoribosyltransferase